jgi:lipopolysaccharide export system protein LptC
LKTSLVVAEIERGHIPNTISLTILVVDQDVDSKHPVSTEHARLVSNAVKWNYK